MPYVLPARQNRLKMDHGRQGDTSINNWNVIAHNLSSVILEKSNTVIISCASKLWKSLIDCFICTTYASLGPRRFTECSIRRSKFVFVCQRAPILVQRMSAEVGICYVLSQLPKLFYHIQRTPGGLCTTTETMLYSRALKAVPAYANGVIP